MTELERVECDIVALQESIRTSTHTLGDSALSVERQSRERASIELYQRHLDELLTKRDDLRALASD